MKSILIIILLTGLTIQLHKTQAQRPGQVIPFLVKTTLQSDGLDMQATGQLQTFKGTYLYEATDWKWDFGDNNIAEGMIVQHRYHEPGTYKLCLSTTGPETFTRYCHWIAVDGKEIGTRPGMQVSYHRSSGALFTIFDTQLGTGALRIVDDQGVVLLDGPLSIENMEMDFSRVRPGVYSFTVRQPWIEEDHFELYIGQ